MKYLLSFVLAVLATACMQQADYQKEVNKNKPVNKVTYEKIGTGPMHSDWYLVSIDSLKFICVEDYNGIAVTQIK